MPDTDERILIVDDEVTLLKALTRQLGAHYTLVTASGPEEALRLVESGPPFAVVVTDYQMPGMDGVELLARVRALSPDSVRVLLTGHPDLEMAVNAVNQGNIFRLLLKPCPPETLHTSLTAALDQWRLVQAEKIILRRTLTGSVKVLTELLALVNPLAFSRALRLRRYAEEILAALGLADCWQVPLAAMLSQTGCVTLPVRLTRKIEQGQPLSLEEQALYNSHPAVGASLLHEIPRLGVVADIVRRQLDPVDPTRLTGPPDQWDTALLGHQVLHVARAIDELAAKGISEEHALQALRRQPEQFAPQVLAAILERATAPSQRLVTRPMPIRDLATGMLLLDDIRSRSDILLVGKGHEVSEVVLQQIRNYVRRGEVDDTARIRVRVACGESEA